MQLIGCLGGLQIGGGINDNNAQEWLDAGASKVRATDAPPSRSLPLIGRNRTQVIVTSHLFPSAKFSLDRLKTLAAAVGRDRLVVDVRHESFVWSSIGALERNHATVVDAGVTSGWWP